MMLSAFSIALLLPTAGPDNNVEWSGVSHVSWIDRSPQVPVDGEAFTITFQAFTGDLTAAGVHVDDGATSFVDASVVRTRGPYDIWSASLPATVADELSYYLVLTDGSDTDYYSIGGMSNDVPVDGGFVVDYVTLSHAPLGATPTSDGGAVFRVWAPGAGSAAVRGEFNDWGISVMTSAGDGTWYRQDSNAFAGDNYKYFFNNSLWKEDARARALNPGDNNNSILVDQSTFAWADEVFAPPPFEEMVIYELHVGSFSGLNDGVGGLGDFRDVVDAHLDHLVHLGVNVVELMPITEFDFFESWGYNPVNQWGPENAYGDPDDLKYMIDRLHAHGIAVIADIVYNHFSTSGNYLWQYDGSQIYFDSPACDTPWGSQPAFWKPEVKDYFAENILYWLDQFHMDGFRMDATSYMRDPLGCYPDGWYLMQQINDLMDNRAVDKIHIAEELPDNTAITTPTDFGGAGFDSQWHDKFNDDVRQEIFDAAFGNPEMFKIRDVLLAPSYPNKTNLVNYVESHDEAGDLNGGQRLAVLIDSNDPFSIWARGRSKLAQGLTILAPGIPMFLQGGEWMEDIQFGAGIDGRIDWAKAADRPEIIQFFSDVIAVRKSNCGLRSDGGVGVHHVNDAANVIGFHRWDDGGNDLVVVGSFNNNDLLNYRVGFPQAGTWYEILNSQASAYLGNGAGNGGSVTTEAVSWDGMAQSAEVTVPQMGLLVFRFEDPPGDSADSDGDGDVDLRDCAVMFAQFGLAGCSLESDVDEDGRIGLGDAGLVVQALTGP